MIAEYALYCEDGLIWYWKSNTPGEKVGGFKDRAMQHDHPRYGCDNPITRLCLSRQLRQETSSLWTKVNTVCFSSQEESPHSFKIRNQKAVTDYDYFFKHDTTRTLARIPTVILEVFTITHDMAAMCSLSEVTLGGRHPEIRVIETGFSLDCHSRHGARRFRSFMRMMEKAIRKCESVTGKRIWKVYPITSSPEFMECLRKFLSPEDLSSALDFIEKGI